VASTDTGTTFTPGEIDFQEGEVARIEVYEEMKFTKKLLCVRK